MTTTHPYDADINRGSLVIATDGTNWLGTFGYVLRLACEDLLQDGPVPIALYHEAGAHDVPPRVEGMLSCLEHDRLVIDTGGPSFERYEIGSVIAVALG
jgi:hypothetical protein